jgi:SAM-dependent methyltransferase
LFRDVPRFPPSGAIADGDLFSLRLANDTAGLTHGLHRFAGKYVPHVPAWALEELAGASSAVLDPFCGSGTTLVEALPRCRRCVGIDRDPLACLIAGAKTAALDPGHMAEVGDRLLDKWREPAPTLQPPMPDLDNFGHWFSGTGWGWLQSLLATIGALRCREEERRFLLCVFSSIVRRVSNADDQTQKTYVSGTLKKHPPEVQAAFGKALQRALAGLRDLDRARRRGAECTVIAADSSDVPLPPGSIDLVVTSPPYLDSVDYMYNFMLEYFWLGPLLGIADRRTFNRLRREVIGAKNPLPGNVPPLPSCLRELIREDDVLPARRPAVRAYCHDMARHFASAARVLRPEGRYVLVAGNSRTGNGVLPLHDALVRLAADAGLALEKAFAYRIRRHYMKFPRKGNGGIITLDWVIVLRKGPGRASYPERLPLPDFTLRGDEVAN